MKKREPAGIRFNCEEDNIPQLIEDYNMVKLVIEHSFEAIKEARRLRKSSASIFSVIGTELVLELDQYQYKPALQAALNFYEKQEDWDKCCEIRDLINGL